LRVAALVTGGKDSALALYRAMVKGYDVKYLVTMIPRSDESWMFHYPNIHLAELFAEATGVKLLKKETLGIKELELEDLKLSLAKLDVEGVVYGAISSSYQKNRIEKICKELKLKPIAPLWQENPIKLLKEILDLKFQVIIVGVYAYGFNDSWLGKEINEKTVKELEELNRQYGTSLVGEGGEYETLVLDAPFFKKRIRLIETEKIWKGESGYLLVKRAELVEKIY
jgi:diphthine-ammonia ligase